MNSTSELLVPNIPIFPFNKISNETKHETGDKLPSANKWEICNRYENNGKTQIKFNYHNKNAKYKTKQTQKPKYIELKTE